MATVTVTCNKDARVAVSGGTSLGSGTSTGLPFGVYSGYQYRSLLGFPLNFAGWTAINGATLYLRNSNQIHVAFGSSPTLCTERITSNWSEGSSNGLSGSNAVVWGGPSVTATNRVAGSGMGTAENTWKAINITAMMRDVLAGNAFYGLRLTAWNGSAESGSSVDVGEIYSREAGSAAYIVFDYVTNTPPTAPGINSPDGGTVVTSQTPTLSFTPHDPQGDSHIAYRYQVALDSGFASVFEDQTVGGTFGDNVAINRTVINTEARGTTYYWRVATTDAAGVYGPWSATAFYKVASVPSVTVSEPSGAGRLGHLWYVAGSGWVSPRLEVDWALSCPDGGSQYSYRVEVQADSAGSPSGNYTNGDDSTTLVDSSTTQRVVPITLTEGAYYHVQVTATCSHGLSQTVTWRRVRVRWAVVTHQLNMTAPTGSLALTVLDVTDETNGGSGRVVVEYMTAAGTAVPTSWASTIGGAGLLQYFNYRAWLLAWGASPAVSPSLNEIKVTYTTATITPDKWTITDPPNQSGDVAAYVYGTKSLRLKGTGAVNVVSQAIPVAPNTYYVLSGRVQSTGNSGAYIDLATSAGGGQLVLSTPKTQSVGFESPLSRVVAQAPTTPFAIPWYSGNNTQVFVRCVVTGAVGTTGWFDALKVEASTVVTPWTPGYVANAVVLDAGGLQIDAFNGGIFRLRGLNGGVRDTVDLGPAGLVFGGDTNLISPAKNVLQITDPYGSTDTPAFRVGDDAEFFDVDLGGSLGLRSTTAPADGALYLGTNKDVAIYRAAAGVMGFLGLLASGGPLRFGGNSFPTGQGTGDLFFRTDLRTWFMWDGGTWIETLSLSGTAQHILSGSWTVGASAGQATFTFPRAFASRPVVTIALESGSRNYMANLGTVTASTFIVVVAQMPGATPQLPVVPTTALSGSYIAFGPR